MSSTALKTRKSAPGENQAPEIRRLSSLLEVSQSLSGTLNLKSAMHNVLEILARHHGAVRGIGGRPRKAGRSGEVPDRRGHPGARGGDGPPRGRAARQQRADAAAPRV